MGLGLEIRLGVRVRCVVGVGVMVGTGAMVMVGVTGPGLTPPRQDCYLDIELLYQRGCCVLVRGVLEGRG